MFWSSRFISHCENERKTPLPNVFHRKRSDWSLCFCIHYDLSVSFSKLLEATWFNHINSGQLPLLFSTSKCKKTKLDIFITFLFQSFFDMDIWFFSFKEKDSALTDKKLDPIGFMKNPKILLFRMEDWLILTVDKMKVE